MAVVRPVLDVLVAVADVRLVEALTAFLETAGYHAESAWTLGDALDAVKEGRADVVLLGGRTDGLDAVEVLDRIRALDRSVPVILVSADNGEGAPRRPPTAPQAFAFRVTPGELHRLDAMLADVLISFRRAAARR